MSEIAVTIVGNNLNNGVENRVADIIKKTGVDNLSLDRLHQGYALDILVKGTSFALIDLLRQKLADIGPFDVFVQPNDPFRRKKLLVADMDATIIRQETIDELAEHLGLKDKISVITERGMRGEIEFHESLCLRVKMLAGLPLGALAETLGKISCSTGAERLVKTMRRHGARCILVSGGFDFFTVPVAEKTGFHQSFGNRLEISDGKLTGNILPPILDKDSKLQTLVDQAKALGLPLQYAMAIGDGANDVPMLEKAGVGIGYFAKPAVQAATPHQIRHTDLAAALYMQGYRQEELV